VSAFSEKMLLLQKKKKLLLDDRIKLIYCWLGPTGPIWNTELPNILNFASVSDSIKHIDSQKFWGDDARSFFSCESNNYDVYPVCSMEQDDERPFILPFGLSWRIPFDRYFTGNEGIIEFSHVPSNIIRLVRQRNGFIMINHSIEAFMAPEYLNVLHGYFQNVHGLPLHKVIYLTGCINAQELYNQYCEQRNIPNDKIHRLSIVTYATSFRSFVSHTQQLPPFYDTESVPEKLFLMWNRRIRQHRVELVATLERYGLVDRSLVSFSDVNVDRPGLSSKDSIHSAHLQNVFDISQDVVGRFVARLPLVLDGENDVNQMCQDYENKSRPFYQKSLVSIVTETNFYDSAVSLTEKSFKPAKEMHPFIIAGVSGAIKGMHELGFKTFGEFWDEGYDDIKDHTERMREIMKVIAAIGSWSDEQIIDFRRRVKPILEHNYLVIRNAGSNRSVEKITSIIRGK
jgi:hypothetical protein